MKLKLLAAMTASALGILAATQSAHAMDFHVNGHQIILSGDVTRADGFVLADLLARLHAQGRTIDTLVMRNSNGGSVIGGYDIAELARRQNLKTVASGYCISACSMMFVGGAERAFDGGPNKDVVGQQNIQIHGQSNSKGYVDSSRGTEFYQHFVDAIANGDLSKTDAALLDKAFSSTTLALLWDPSFGKQPSVYWGTAGTKAYQAFSSDDVYNTGFVTQHTPEMATDTLTIQGRSVSGNINPNYYNKYDPATGQVGITNRLYNAFLGPILVDNPPTGALSSTSEFTDLELAAYNAMSPADRKAALTAFIVAQGYSQAQTAKYLALINQDSGNPLVDTRAISIGNAWGIVRLVNSSWTLSTGERAATGALLLTDSDMRLRGGIVDVSDIQANGRSTLSGEGQMGETTLWSKLRFVDNAVLHPTGHGIDWTGNPQLQGNAALSFDITPGQAGQPALLRFNLFNGGSYTSMSGLSIISRSAQLGLNIAPGFYPSGSTTALVGYATDIDKQLAAAKAAGNAPDGTDIIIRRFTHLVRSDADGHPIAGYDIDPTDTDSSKATFRPFDGTLIGYSLVQQSNGIWLQANDAFKGQSAFCGRDGCGLGDTLSLASTRPDTPLAPLLGALQFSTVAQATHAAGQIRGEGYAALRTASLSLLGDFSGTLSQHVRAVSPGSDDGATAAFMNGAAGMGLDGTRRGTDVASMMRYLVAPDEVAGGSNTGHTAVWGRLFGSKGRLDAQGDAAGLREHTTGAMLGVDVPLKDNVVIGGSLGYGKLRANDSGSAFQGRVRALDARFYADYRYDGGYLDASLGYTRLRQNANRGIDLPLYAARGYSHDTGNAWSLHLEHGLTLRDRHDIVWQPILPSLDMVRLPENRFSDKGLGAAGLDVRAKSTTDTRLGVGVQVYKVFAWGYQGTWTPHARVLLQHRFNRHENEFMANLQGYPEGVFQVTGPNEGLNHAIVNVGLSAKRSQRVAFTVDYVGDYAKRHRDQGVMLGASYRW
ncbi:MAG: hypothetical protein GAK28_03809 [Luteibacter sp.]|uniref:autotransporter domain-containing protein n=1 Tax=Luteibacter sp. TaxID=1886636 RepID=UPI00137D8E6A|nr:autotransporter domain-containing protein [Luteibacter sp.]KAF1004796.1 MAG: hypothetical protein GAK28_03809 [Luteibacter sp.]